MCSSLPIFQVKVGHENLVGEVIRINADQSSIQVYEETGKLSHNSVEWIL